MEQAGILENTVIIYLGDHGYLLNDHKRFEKHMMWEEAIRSPLIVRAGSLAPTSLRNDALVEFVDLASTICDAIQVDHMPDDQGLSLWPIITQQKTNHKDTVFAEFLADNKAMVATKDWKYVYSTGLRDLAQGYATGNPPMGVTHRLYDLIQDQGETRSVAKDAENREVLEAMQRTMIHTFAKTHPNANELPDGLDVNGILAWYCVPPDEGADLGAQ